MRAKYIKFNKNSKSESFDTLKPLDRAPMNIEEIYNLANKNRKKNKCKKRKDNKSLKEPNEHMVN